MMKDDVVYCASAVDVRSKTCMISHWKARVWVLRDGVLYEAASQIDIEKHNKVKRYTVLQGKKWEERLYGIMIETKEVGWMYANIALKATWAMWVHSFLLLDFKYTLNQNLLSQRVSCPSEDDIESCHRSQSRRVAFNGQVRVRKIPALTDEEALDLFYTKSEMEAFKGSVTTLKSFAVVMV